MKKYLVWLLVSYCGINCCLAQPAAPVLVQQPFFTAIIAGNIDSSENWYSKHFGLQVRNRNENHENGTRQVIMQSESLFLELIELRNSISISTILKNASPGARIQGLFKIGFVVNDLDKYYETARIKGANLLGSIITDPVSGQRSFILLDPDRNRIQLFEKIKN